MLKLIIFLFISSSVYSQHEDTLHAEHHGLEYYNSFYTTLGYTYVRGGEHIENEVKGVFVPAIGFDYFRKLNHKWSVGVTIDWELADYVIITKDLNRSKALLLVGGASYEFTKHFGGFLGAGIEIEKHKNLAILRAGLEFPFEIGKRFLLKPEFIFDFKEGYDTYTTSIAFGIRF